MTRIVVVSAIGTEVGKTYATGLLLRRLEAQGGKARSFKLVQTGVAAGAIAPDIVAHRRIAGQALDALDRAGKSCGACYPTPCSPHLAAALAGRPLQLSTLDAALDAYAAALQADWILCETAGGIFAPLNDDFLSADWLAQRGWPWLMVGCGRLGSLHETIATLEALAARALLPQAFLYNDFPIDASGISADSAQFLRRYLAQHFPSVEFLPLEAPQLPSFIAKEFFL